MLLELVAHYYKYLWLAFTALALLKIILSYSFHGELEGINGAFYALFKWYGEEEQEMEDETSRRTTMRVHNMITLGIYAILLLIVIASLLPRIFGR